MSSLYFHDDGCLIGNIETHSFTVIFAPKCPHTKIRHVELELIAESMDAAKEYAEMFIHLSQMVVSMVYPTGNPPRSGGIPVTVKRPTIRTKEV